MLCLVLPFLSRLVSGLGFFKLSALLPGILFLLAICLQFIPGKLSIGVIESLVDMLLI